jgi:hypothetical protein
MGLAQSCFLRRILIGPHQIKDIAAVLGSQPDVVERSGIMRLGKDLDRNFMADHSPIHALNIAIGEVLQDDLPRPGYDPASLRRQLLQMAAGRLGFELTIPQLNLESLKQFRLISSPCARPLAEQKKQPALAGSKGRLLLGRSGR